jgi:hypothetical protein
MYRYLIPAANSGESDGQRLARVDFFLSFLLHFEHLFDGGVDRHIPWWVVLHFSGLVHVVHIRFLHFDVQQTQGVQPHGTIALDLIVETIGAPILLKKNDRHGLAVPVQLQPTRTNGVHDRGVVINHHFDAEIAGPHQEIGMCRGAERIAHHQKGDILG